MEETQWIDWHPKVGDIKPERYRFRHRSEDNRHPWTDGDNGGRRIDAVEYTYNDYQIPATVVTPPEDRPPWIDPQCKFRWGDRVKDAHGRVLFVINPQDTTNRGFVVVATRLSAAVPYAVYNPSNLSVGFRFEDDLELFPEELPQHFDDRLLDADQPQEQPKTARVPREIWINTYGESLGQWVYLSQNEAEACSGSTIGHAILFREVLPDDLSNIQYSPGG